MAYNISTQTISKKRLRTRKVTVSKDGLDHGSDLIFTDRSKRLESFWCEELKRAHFSNLHVVGTIISPYQILTVAAECFCGSVPVTVGEFLVVLFEDFFG